MASAELVAALREGHPGLEVGCAPTPEIDRLLEGMREQMGGENAHTEQSYLSPDVGPDAVAAFFRAAALLYRAKPWEIVPNDQSLFSVTIEKALGSVRLARMLRMRRKEIRRKKVAARLLTERDAPIVHAAYSSSRSLQPGGSDSSPRSTRSNSSGESSTITTGYWMLVQCCHLPSRIFAAAVVL